MPTQTAQHKLIDYLTDIHSTEANALTQLKDGADAAEDTELAAAFRDHLAETRDHEALVRSRLEALGGSTSATKDALQTGVAKMTGVLSKAAPDTSGKMAIHAYAFEHLEIASYRMLRVAAREAGDVETESLAQRILAEEEVAAHRLEGLLDRVAHGDLARQAEVGA